MAASAKPLPEFLRLSTDAVPERDRLAVWREVYGRLMFNMDIDPIGDDAFRAEVALRRLPGAGISMGSRSPAKLTITRALLATASDNIVLAVVLKGRAHASQLGRDESIAQGGAVLMTTCDVGIHTLFDQGQHLTVQLPREVLVPFVPDLGSRLMRPFSPDSQALKLMIAYARAAMQLDASSAHDLQRHVAVHLRDIIAFISGMQEHEIDAQGEGGIRAARLRAIKMAIESQLGFRDLSAETLALAQQISPDYVRKLLREDGTSFSEYVLTRRLARAHAMLSDPLRAGQRIASIAFEVGFNDLSYFNRTFRLRYRRSPSEVRNVLPPAS